MQTSSDPAKGAREVAVAGELALEPYGVVLAHAELASAVLVADTGRETHQVRTPERGDARA
jgi:hypothetical protein